jgi:hypothetical protein
MASRLALTLLVVAIAVPAFAQNAGSLRGTVTDETGNVVAKADVTLISQTGFTVKQVSDDKGGFFFAAVDSGLYSVEASRQGFKSWKAKDLRISSNDTVSLSVKLKVGEISETVNVVASREMISNNTGAREGLITPEQLESISIIGRNATELIRILPGVVAPDQAQFEQVGTQTGFGAVGNAYSINGARAENLGVTLDGANLHDPGNNSAMMNVPNNEFISEVKVMTSNYAAEYGSAIISMQAITKAGSADFHGSLYTYGRPYQWSANDRSRTLANQAQPKSQFNYPGATLSGPILIPGTGFNKNKDKAFFFVGFEIQKQNIDTGVVKAVVPTAGMRAGNFNDYLGGQNLGFDGTLNIPLGFPNAGQPVPNRDMTPYLTPTGTALMKLFPASNYNDPVNRYNYITTRLANDDRTQGTIRLDYNISDNTRAYIRLSQDAEAPEQYRGLWWQANQIEMPTPIVETMKGRSAALNITSVLSPTTTNEVIFSYSRFTKNDQFKDPSLMMKSTYGITDAIDPFDPTNPFVPQICNNYDGGKASMWFSQDVALIFAYNGYARFQDNLTKVMNAHAAKVGVVVERMSKQQNFQHNADIEAHFDDWAHWSGVGTGNPVADVLAGRPDFFNIGQPSAIGNFLNWNLEAFVQDSWKVAKNFTLEYGLRFGKWTNNEETSGLGAVFNASTYDPSKGTYIGTGANARLNGLQYARFGEIPNTMVPTRPLIWEPRLNFAWDVKGNGSTVIRGGGGVFYNREQGNTQYSIINVPPNSFSGSLNADTDRNAFPGKGYNGYNGLDWQSVGYADPFSSVGGKPGIGTPNIYDLNWPRTVNASFGVSQRLPLKNVLEVSYVGTFGRHLVGQQNVNTLQPGDLYTKYSTNPLLLVALNNDKYNTFLPYPQLGGVSLPVYVGVSNYNSLQATLSRQAGAFTYLVAYTFSRSRGTVAGDFASIDPTSDWQVRDYGILATNRTHVLNVSWTLRLGSPVKNGAAKLLVNGWNLSGVSTYSSGQPFRPVFGGDIGSGGMSNAWWGTKDYVAGGSTGTPGAISPTYSCNPNISGATNKVGTKLWDLSCMGFPAYQQDGSYYPPNTMTGPSRSFHDVTIFKDFGLGGARRVQVRLGAFNVFNQAYPDMIGNNDVNTTFEGMCNVSVPNVSNGNGGTGNACDPQGGFHFSDNTKNNFGQIITKRGHRSIEYAVKFYF